MISIIIPTYNRPDYLSQLLESIDKQTYTGMKEAIVIDDYSTQTNQQKNQEVCKRFDFVTYIQQQKHYGPPRNRNNGVNHSQGELLCFSDDDDIWHPEKLEKQQKMIRQNGDVLVYTRATVFLDDNISKTYSTMEGDYDGDISSEILLENVIPSSSVMLTRTMFERAGGFDTRFPSCQDRQMRVSINQHYPIKVIREHLLYYRKHQKGSVGLSKKAGLGYLMFSWKFKKLFWQFRLFKKRITMALYGGYSYIGAILNGK